MENAPSKSLLLNFDGRVSLNDTYSLNIFSEYLFHGAVEFRGRVPLQNHARDFAFWVLRFRFHFGE